MDADNNSKMGKRKAPRHTPHHIQQPEAFFKECRNPNENQKRQLSRELSLGQNQIKFWFQNKRNQRKAQSDHVDKTVFRSENLAFSERLKNAICPTCDDHPPVGEEERKLNMEKLKRENAQLREEYESIANKITSRTGKPISHLLSLPPESLERLLSLPANDFLGQQSGSSSIVPCTDYKNSHNSVAADEAIEMSENDKIMMVQIAGHALNELAHLLLAVEPLWVRSPTYGGFVLHYENYFKNFPKSRHLKCRISLRESSRDLAEVPIAASDLVEMFMDARKWADLFPTIVTEAKIIETLDTGSNGGSLNLMYVRTHILSSLVAPREFVFLRYCLRLGPGTLFIVDASYDSKIQDSFRTFSWRFPSGLMIESLSNGNQRFFEECPNPNDNQKRQLSRKLGLDQNQVRFWFQNKRNQRKIHNDRLDNSALRSENERLQSENLAFSEVLKNVICSACDVHPPVGEEERRLNIEKLRRENAQLKEECERIANEITSKTGKPISHLLSLPPESLENLLNLPAESFLGQQSGNSSIGPCFDPTNSHNQVAAIKPIEVSEDDKILMVQKAGNDLNELAELLLAIEPLWVMLPTYGGYVLHDGNYSKSFPKSRHLKCMTSRIESSRDSAVVPIAASNLVEMFLDMRKRADLFPTIVMEAKILETLNTGSLAGSLHLMYERTHILSSLVAPREFVFLRYCQQMGPGTWLIVDASYDCFREIQNMPPTHSWMFPSGLMIESLPDGKSMVTWTDHVEVDGSPTDPLYSDLMSSVHGYGAKRWLSSLERMIERSLYSFSPGTTSSPELEGINTVEGRKNIMALSQRMIREFCTILSMPERCDLSGFTTYKVRMSVRDNNELGQPHCMIVAASTSIWLPLTFENVFNFLRDQHRRPEWDVMLNRSPVNEIAHMLTGIHPGNGISIIKPCVSNKQNKLLLQENSIDPLGAFVVFSSVESEIIKAVINGGDSITILPCGFLISSDRGPIGEGSSGASSSTGVGSSRPFGSLVTLAFQLSVKGNGGSLQIQKAAANTLNDLVISIIKNLEVAFGCNESD